MSSFTADKRYVFSEDSSRNVPEKRDVSKTKDVFTCPDETDSLDISEESGSGDRRDSLKEIPPAESLRTMYRRSTETGIMGVAMRNVLHFGNVLNYLDNADVFEDVIKTEDFEDIEGDASFSQCVANIVNLVVVRKEERCDTEHVGRDASRKPVDSSIHFLLFCFTYADKGSRH